MDGSYQIRTAPLQCEQNLLKNTDGSALFSAGEVWWFTSSVKVDIFIVLFTKIVQCQLVTVSMQLEIFLSNEMLNGSCFFQKITLSAKRGFCATTAGEKSTIAFFQYQLSFFDVPVITGVNFKFDAMFCLPPVQ